MKIMGHVKGWVLDLANWSKKHLEKLIILIGVFIMTFILFVLLSWAIGYYANGFFGMKFELGSIWQGLGACVAAITGLITMAGTSLAKLYVNSRYNSPQGEQPQRMGAKNDERDYAGRIGQDCREQP